MKSPNRYMFLFPADPLPLPRPKYIWNECISALTLERVTSLLWVSFYGTVKWESTILPEIVVLKVKRDKVCESVYYKVPLKGTDVQDIMNEMRPLPPIYKFSNILAPRVLHGARQLSLVSRPWDPGASVYTASL